MLQAQNQHVETYTAFDGHKQLTKGSLEKVVLKVKAKLKENPLASILVFSDTSGKQMDFDLRGSEKDVLGRLQIYISQTNTNDTPSGPGRPKLGVVSREISLLPRHWEWLSNQSGGASATIRRLVDEAKKQPSNKELVKLAQERTYKFMSSIAGNLPHYEEALRALFSKNKKAFETQMADWPKDIRTHAESLAMDSFL